MPPTGKVKKKGPSPPQNLIDGEADNKKLEDGKCLACRRFLTCCCNILSHRNLQSAT